MTHRVTTGPTAALLTPMLAIRKADEAIAFYARAFDAVELFRLVDPAGKIVHAEIKIGDSLVMIAEEDPDYNASPQTLGKSTVILSLSVPNADAAFSRAVAAGARVVFPLQDQFYGERAGRIEDPFGHLWIISTTIEKVSPDEMQRRFSAMCAE